MGVLVIILCVWIGIKLIILLGYLLLCLGYMFVLGVATHHLLFSTKIILRAYHNLHRLLIL